MKRRSFLSSILAAGMAPAIGHAGILMPVRKIARFDPFGQFGFTEPIDGYREYFVVIHPDEGLWWKEQTGFVPVQHYASMKPLPNEIGSICGGTRLIVQERLKSILCPEPSTLYQPLKPTPRPT